MYFNFNFDFWELKKFIAKIKRATRAVFRPNKKHRKGSRMPYFPQHRLDQLPWYTTGFE